VDRVELLDIWLPDEGVVVTLPGDTDAMTQLLREREYSGPEFGPYDMFCYARVPDNVMPVPVLSTVRDLAEVINALARKIKRQSERQKDVGVYSMGHEEAAEVIRTAPDGAMVGVPDKNQIDVLSFGGPNESNYKAVAWFRDYYNLIAGNPELLSGAGPQANTLGQDEMNRAAASVRLSDWRAQILAAAASVVRKVAWYEWTDPVTDEELRLALPSGIEIPVRWSAKAREGDFLDYNFEINPYRRRLRDPEQQYRRTMEWLTNVAIPLSQLGAPQGVMLDVEEAARVTARQLGVDVGPWIFRRGAPLNVGNAGGYSGVRVRPPDNRVVRRLPAKPERIEGQAEEAGIETKGVA